MSESLRVSVVVPCHNAAPYLAEALTSVLSQRAAPEEVFVIDDGSTDDSAAVAARFGTRVRLVRQEQGGISAARNRGLDLATGDAIAFLDADDIWPDGSLFARRAVLETQPALESVHGLVRQFISPELPEEIQRALVVDEAMSRARVAGAMLVRRTVFARVGGFDPAFRIGETLDWVARADLAGVTHDVVDEVVRHRRLHTTNTTTRLRNEKGDYLRVLKATIDRRRAAAPQASTDQG